MKWRNDLALACSAAAVSGLGACIFVVHDSNEGATPRYSSVDGAAVVIRNAAFDPAKLRAHIDRLASDEFEGRGPGTRGEELATAYLKNEFKALGLSPGNPDGTFVQRVPLTGFRSTSTHQFDAGGKALTFAFPDEAVLLSRRFVPAVDVVDSDIVFVGYGIQAPEYGWDDYKGVDVRGKTILMLVGDPPIPSAEDPAKLDDKVFGGLAMTYYGRWTYKYEIAAEMGAAAALIVHDTGPAGYPFAVVSKSWGRENFDIDPGDGNAHRAAVEGWLRGDKAHELVAAGGQDLDQLTKAALARDFKPVALKAKATFHVKNALRTIQSKNVVARLEGSDAKLRDECIVYSAHWDHLGRDESIQGDGIFNGAVDNASGCAGLLELARVYTQRTPTPPRSIVFLAVTAEEKGLLGSKWYATHPLYPLAKTLCDINMDSLNVWGPTADVISVGYGQTTMDELLVKIAGARGRVVKPNPEPEKGGFYRSDHFEFSKLGVPSLYADGGSDLIGQPPGAGQARSDEYTARDYHQPSDEPKAGWDLSGAALDLDLLYEVGSQVARGTEWPAWKSTSEFRERREHQLAGSAHGSW